MVATNHQTGFIHILPLLILLIGIAGGIYLIQHPQIFKSRATDESSRIEFIGPNVTNDKASSKDITLKIIYVASLTTPIATPNTDNVSFGVNIDIRDQSKIPNATQVSNLNPTWVRFVFPCNLSVTSSCPDDYHKINLIDSIPANLKKLAVINGESTWEAQNGNTNTTYWETYTDTIYVPTLQRIITDYGSKLDGVELWNESDLSDSSMPAASFGYLVKKATTVIKNLNPNIKVITGGLAGGDFSYLHNAKVAIPDAFDKVDGIGIHPYHTPDNIDNITNDLNRLKQQLLSMGISKPIWVTETGIQEYSNQSSPKNQSEFLTNSFSQLINFQPTPEVVLWYAFTDLMGGYGGSNWGLVDGNGEIKPTGNTFRNFTTPPTADYSFFPTAFRIANSQTDLSTASELTFHQNNQELNWTLTDGDELKTVWLQFKVGGVWQTPISASITLALSNPIHTSTTNFSFSSVKLGYKVGEEVAVQILVHSDITASNLFDAKISYDPTVLQLGRVDVASPFIKNWIEQYWDNSGKISLVGGVPNPGFQTQVEDTAIMATLYFTALKQSNTTLSFDETSAIYSNADNSNILVNNNPITLTLNTVADPNPTISPSATPSPTVTPTITPTSTPVPLARGDLNNDNRINFVDASVYLSKCFKINNQPALALPICDLDGNGIIQTFDWSNLIRLLIKNQVIRG